MFYYQFGTYRSAVHLQRHPKLLPEGEFDPIDAQWVARKAEQNERNRERAKMWALKFRFRDSRKDE